MPIRRNIGGYITANPTAPTLSKATGVWTLSQQMQAVGQGNWPKPTPTVIGQAYGGGFYAGKIVQGGTTYFLIVAPKASGENSSKKWKTTVDAGPTATQTLNNGPAASAAMNSASYPAAQFCEGLSIGGYTAWYLPSRDELELCYRNLKSTTAANSTSARPKSTYTYPEGNDVSGDTLGINRNSSPTGAAYTSSVPAQTSVTAFKSGGSEAFAAGWYWSSSEYSASDAWTQGFTNGGQSYGNTTTTQNNLQDAIAVCGLGTHLKEYQGKPAYRMLWSVSSDLDNRFYLSNNSVTRMPAPPKKE